MFLLHFRAFDLLHLIYLPCFAIFNFWVLLDFVFYPLLSDKVLIFRFYLEINHLGQCVLWWLGIVGFEGVLVLMIV